MFNTVIKSVFVGEKNFNVIKMHVTTIKKKKLWFFVESLTYNSTVIWKKYQPIRLYCLLV
jgi:hypothetical protein